MVKLNFFIYKLILLFYIIIIKYFNLINNLRFKVRILSKCSIIQETIIYKIDVYFKKYFTLYHLYVNYHYLIILKNYLFLCQLDSN